MKVVPVYSEPVTFTGDDTVKSIKQCQDFNIMTGGLDGLQNLRISCQDFKMSDSAELVKNAPRVIGSGPISVRGPFGVSLPSLTKAFSLESPEYESCFYYFHGNSMHSTESFNDEIFIEETCSWGTHGRLSTVVIPTKICSKQGFLLHNSADCAGFRIMTKKDCTLIKVDFELE